MPDNLRGSRMGATSLESVRGAVLADAATHTYVCTRDHDVQVTFAADAVPPSTWTCPRHGTPAALVVTPDTPVAPPVGEDEEQPRRGRARKTGPPRVSKTPWEMLLERRDIADLDDLLAERLEVLRARRTRAS
ncbi:RNA polymerase-binding protein RbpA [Klenkia taihuensis]|uniref:RNA polymerase-binding protein RbpA n=1 Tax=Klenkia taihuensis TaxID=1225127 RepID=A0A1I1HTJ1_9ACTN|nr:RNA polymerase-binding protein RbpA [Klenkia taihuensis]GHE09119.1 RNA polymerase-binding protein RbpA [Klenkia taihuensis]SFC25268.1 RNA polymerase-binding protein [Klenkia taihuensis]